MASSEYSDKRSFPRKQFSILVVLKQEDEEYEAQVKDITVGGILVELNRSFNIGAPLTVLLSRNKSVEPTELEGEVVRAQPSPDNQDQYQIGINFHRPDDQYLMDVLAYVHQVESPGEAEG